MSRLQLVIPHNIKFNLRIMYEYMTGKDNRFKDITLDSYLAYFMLDKCDIIRVNLLQIFPSIDNNFKIMLTGTIKDNKFLVDGMINGTEVLTKDVAQDRVLEAKHEYEEVVVELPQRVRAVWKIGVNVE